MVSNIEHLARKFETRLKPKLGTRRGTKMNARKILKELDKARKVYKETRSKLHASEVELERIEGNIQDFREEVRGSRSQMLGKNKVLQNMDLADANYAVFYDNDAADVGYIIGGEEQYLDVDVEGKITLTPMADRRRQQRAERAEQRAAAGEEPEDEEELEELEELEEDEEDEEEDEEEEEEEPEDEDDGDDDNDLDDGFIAHPNLRFID